MSVRTRQAQLFITTLCGTLLGEPLQARAYAQPAPATRHVLALYWYEKDHPINIQIERGIRSALQSEGAPQVEYYAEYLDSNRFPDAAQPGALHDYLQRKYAHQPIDVVIGSGVAAHEFLIQHRSTLFSGAALITLAPARNSGVMSDKNITGLVTYRAFRANLDLVLRLHPATEQVFIISGTLDGDRRFEEQARAELTGYDRNVTMSYLTDLTLGDLIARVRSAPARSIILYAWQEARNSSGDVLTTTDLFAGVAAAARVPIYGMSEARLGSGIVGGIVFSLEDNGRRAGEIALRILRGERASEIGIEDAPTFPMFDWRQLQRWGISEGNLPHGSVIQFRDPSFWERHKWLILGGALVCAVQGALIAALLLQLASRKRAERQAQLQQREVTYLSRIATLGELTGTLAHELRQPLTAIQANAEAARLMLARDSLDRGELTDSLNDIVSANQRAAEVIRRTRGFMRRDRSQRQALQLNEVVNDALALSAGDLALRAVTVSTHLQPDLPSVDGDRVELQQVLLNLILNACEAMSGLPPSRRTLNIFTELTDRGDVQVSVSDRGPGISAESADRIFDPFFTSKEQGLGLGLAICRTIVLAHYGRIWVETNYDMGATFSFQLPAHGVPFLSGT